MKCPDSKASYFEVLVYKDGKGAVVAYRGGSQDRAVAVYKKAVADRPEEPAAVIASWLVRHERLLKSHKMPRRRRTHR
jgi:hypothetical protein